MRHSLPFRASVQALTSISINGILGILLFRHCFCITFSSISAIFSQQKHRIDWAVFMKSIADKYKDASKITLVMDNYGTHTMGSFYEVFPPEVAKALIDRFEFIYTPKHGSCVESQMLV